MELESDIDDTVINITLANEDNLKQINNLYIQRLEWFKENNIKQWGEHYHLKYNVDYLKQQMLINKLYVAKIQNKIIGSMLLKNSDKKIWDDEVQAYYIHHLVTDKNYKGIGKILIEFAKKEAIKDEKEYLRLDTVSKNIWLDKYYRNLGFEYFGEKQIGKGKEKLWQMKVK